MGAWRRFWRRLAALGGGARHDRELDRELAAHLALLEDEYIRRGFEPDVAKRAARLAMGGLDQTRELQRRARAFGWIDDLGRDLRHAGRAHLKAPGTAALSIATLALGIATAASLFSLVDAVLFRPLPVERADRVVRVWALGEESEERFGLSWPVFREVAGRTASAESVAGFTAGLAVHLSFDGQPADRVTAGAVTGAFFPLLGVTPAAGRLIGPSDDATPGANPVMVLSHGYWQARFGSDPAVIGTVVRVNTHPFTVVGVAPAGFHGAVLDEAPDVWVPVSMIVEAAPMFAQFKPFERRGFTWLDTIVRLKPGVSAEQASQELSSLLKQITPGGDGPAMAAAAVTPLAEASLGDDADARQQMAWLLVGVGVVMLTVAGAVVAGLQVVRAESRRREVALQYALGASRSRVARQVLAESGALACVAAILGLAAAQGITGLSATLATATLSMPPATVTPLLTWRVLLLTFVMAASGTGLLGWLVASRVMRGPLTAGIRARPGGRRIPARRVFVVVQVAMSAVLLVGAGLLIRTVDRATGVALGFTPDGVLTATVDVTRSGYDRERGRQFFKDLTGRLRTLPGVVDVAYSRHVPVTASVSSNSLELTNVPARQGEVLESSFTPISPGYLRVMGIRVEQGRDLAEADEQRPLGLIVNRAFADRFWPGLNPLEQRVLNFGEGGTPIVGVAASTKLFSLREDDQPMLYVPEWAMFEGRMTVVIRTAGDPLSVAPALVATVTDLDPGVPVYQIRTLADRVAASLGRERTIAGLLSGLAVVAVLLAATGLYGVISHATAVRRREFGVRLALGSSRSAVLRQVVGEGAVLSCAGLVAGLGIAAFASRALGSLLFGVEPTDAITFVTIGALLLTVALVASLVPALRAARVDPAVTLRAE